MLPDDFDQPIRYIRLNIHFMQNTNDFPGGGNFTSSGDGMGGLKTGDIFAQDIIDGANNFILGTTQAMNLPPGNTTPVLDKNFRFVLNKVIYHDDPNNYYFDDIWNEDLNIDRRAVVNNLYGEDFGSVINVYLTGSTHSTITGVASFHNELGGNRVVFLQYYWQHYIDNQYPNPPTDPYHSVFASDQLGGLLSHEVGHNLELRHTVSKTTSDDGCPDTPTPDELNNIYNISIPQCGPDNGYMNCSNNMMDYNGGYRALTPCQIQKSYETLMNPHSNFGFNGMENYVTNPCDYTGNDYNVYGTQVWDVPYRTYGDIVVQPGAHLTIKCKVVLSPGAEVIVERGAVLVLDGGTLTTSCDGMWKGILVKGHTNYSQYPLSILGEQGYLFMRNNSLIEHAEIGAHAPNGGVIQASNSGFWNNEVGAKFEFYQNRHPNHVNVVPIANASFFINCDFRTLGTLNNSSGYMKNHVEMWGVDGIRFQGTSFRNLNTSNPGSIVNRGMGIYAFDAAFTVSARCTSSLQSLGQPCSSWDTPLFVGFQYGIYARSYNPLRTVSVTRSNFTGNWRGIYLEGMDHAEINQSTFHINKGEGYVTDFFPEDKSYGVYLRGCKAFSVEENLFDSNSEPVYGIALHSTNTSLETSEEIYRNIFRDLTIATYAKNRNDGLVIKCNSYEDNGTDIMVDGASGKIFSPQGTCFDVASPAGNLFDHNPCLNQSSEIYKGTASNILHYAHHSGPSGFIPNCPQNVTLTPCSQTFDLQNSCPSKLPDPQSGDQGQITAGKVMQDQRIGRLINDGNVIDGGNSSYLITQVRSQTNASLLLNDLMTSSPYLSDAVLLEMVTNTTTSLSQSEIVQVLVANSPVTTTVDEAVSSMNPGLSGELLTDYTNAQTGTSARWDLVQGMITTRREIDLLTDQIIRNYIHHDSIPNDTIIWSDSLRLHLQGIDNNLDDDLHSDPRVRLAEALIAGNDLSNAAQTLTAYLNDGGTNNQAELLQILIQTQQTGATILNISPAALNEVRNIAADQTHHGHVNANGLLVYLDQISYPEEFYQGSSQRSGFSENETQEEAAGFQLFPNPTTGSVTIVFDEDLEAAPTQIEIMSALGQSVKILDITTDSKTVNTNLGDLSNGTYLVVIKSQVNIIGQQILVVKH